MDPEKTPLNPFKIMALMLAYFFDGVHRGATARLCFAQHCRASGTWDCLAPDPRISEMAIENEIAYVEGIEKYSPRSGLVQPRGFRQRRDDVFVSYRVPWSRRA